ncbi:MAG: phage baseplate assembly protein V [Deltaproteobacteria bacterium]|jgi:uncharacterized protein involved in type VI secretion and phage assembly|nr:phage baseplate assembly protein V [Deltaproteobacteria bacterium]
MSAFAEPGFGLELPGLELELRVAGFRGRSGLNSLYSVTCRCLADARDFARVGARGVLGSRAALTLRDPVRPAGDARPGRDDGGGPEAALGRWPGTVTRLRVVGSAGQTVVLDLTLAPALSLLLGKTGNSIHLDRSGPEAAAECLEGAGSGGGRVRRDVAPGLYPKREFCFRRNEDPLTFAMRILERDGVALSFDMTGESETAVMTDSNSSFPALAEDGREIELDCSEASGMAPGAPGALYGARRELRVPKARVRVRDFDWRSPGRPLQAVCETASWGRGEIYLSGENCASAGEAERLARCVADSELWMSERVTGVSHVPGLRAGVTVRLAGSGSGLDGRYLVEAHEMEGSQLASLGYPAGSPGTGEALGLPELLGDGIPETEPFGGSPEYLSGPDGAGGRVPPAGAFGWPPDASFGPRPEGPAGAGYWPPDVGAYPGPGRRGTAEGAVRHRLVLGRLERPYRPARTLARPNVSGGVSAWIDGAGSGDVPETDAMGRYRVIFPPDLSGRARGGASHWIRMAQPSIGAGYGQNVPLAPGCEVLVTFTGGDPDRPVIAGAMPNAESGSYVNSSSPAGAAVGSRGGSSLGFAERPDGSDAILSAGSGRGHLSVHAGSPTFTQIHADLVTQLNTVTNSTSIFTSFAKAGYFYRIRASEEWTSNFVRTQLVVREALSAFSDLAGAVAAVPGAPDTPDVPVRGVAALVSDIGAMADYAVAPVKAFGQFLQDRQARAAEEVDPRGAPDINVFGLTADGEGADAVWRSSATSDDMLTRLLMLFLMIAKPVRDAVSGYRDSDLVVSDQAHAKDKEDGVSRPGTSKTRTDAYSKASLKWRVAEATACKVVADIFVLTGIIKQMLGLRGAPTGVRVENRDSYVAVLADGFGAMSSRGPLVLESGADRIGDDLLHPLVRGSAGAASLVSGESGAAAADFSGRETVLLRGRVIRALSRELELSATELVVAKTPGTVRLATGTNRAAAPAHDDRGTDLALGDRVVLNAGPALARGVTIEVSPEEEIPPPPEIPPQPDAVPLAVPDAAAAAAAALLAAAAVAAADAGDVLAVQEIPVPPLPPAAPAPASPPVARMLAKSEAGAVTLMHGTFSGGEAAPGSWKDGGRRLVLSADGAILQDAKDRNLVMGESVGTKLSAESKLSLTLKDGVSTLEAGDGTALSIAGSGDIDIKMQQGMRLKAGPGSLELSATDLKVAHPLKVDIKGTLVKLG